MADSKTTQGSAPTETTHAGANRPPRPPGEIGGHTVQPHEQTTASQGMTGTGSTSRATPAPTEGQPPNPGGNLAAAQAAGDVVAGDAAAGSPSATRPPRPSAAQGGAGTAARGAGLQQGELVERISQRLAENFAKALHQSIEEAVRDALGESPATAPRQPTEAERREALQRQAASRTA